MSASAPAVRAVLFDLDGTLLDTAHDMADTLNGLRREEGLAPLDFARIRAFVSHGAAALVRLGFPHAPEPEFLALRERLLEAYRGRLAERTRPFEGMPELLERLEQHGIPWGIVTNKPGWLTEPLLEALGLRRRARVVVSGDTLPERKPHPRPLIHAAELLAVPARECVYVGDAERDVIAAHAAGMVAVVACFGYLGPDDSPHSWPADVWVDSPLEIWEWLQRSAPHARADTLAQ